MNPTEDLREEHGIMMRMFAVLQNICRKMEKHESVNEAHL